VGLAAIVAHAQGGPGGWHGRGMAGGMMGEGPMGLFESFDQNDDGKVTQEEINAVRDERFARFDSDGDGRLSLQEYEALWLDAMRTRMVRQFQAHDADGDAAVTPEEFRARYARMVSVLDVNGDGEVTRDEIMQMRRGDRDDRGRRGEGRMQRGPRGEGPDAN
ncbi:MAG TPA: hypothetical protein VFG43_15395, partial [Geminicoccaceae bacterium]|nr:hypothetical protein [Geminicoccaceae bacterium]